MLGHSGRPAGAAARVTARAAADRSSYTSPNGSMGKLHLAWTVPFRPGRLTAIARQNGQAVARDDLDTAGQPQAITLTPNTQVLPADGTSLAFLAAEITDRAGVLVSSASNLVQFSVEGPATLAGVDNGHQENPQSYQASSVPAFNGRALVIVQSAPAGGRRPARWGERITVTATSPGLRGAQVTLGSSTRRSPTSPPAGRSPCPPRSRCRTGTAGSSCRCGT